MDRLEEIPQAQPATEVPAATDLTKEQRAFIRSMRDAANGKGQPAREFMEELRREIQMERATADNGSHRNG